MFLIKKLAWPTCKDIKCKTYDFPYLISYGKTNRMSETTFGVKTLLITSRLLCQGSDHSVC